MKQAATGLEIYDKLAIQVAEQLELLDQEYSRLKKKDEELRYYSYGLEHKTDGLKQHAKTIVPQIIQVLLTKRYLLVIQNLNEPIKPIKIDVFTENMCVPPPSWKESRLLVSAASQDVCDRSYPEDFRVIKSFSGDDI
ncbi:unnamed protein product [Urochloa humidicola]